TPAGPTRRPRAVRLRLWHSCTLPFSRTGQGGTGVGWDGADGTAGTAGVGGEAEAVRLIFAATALWWPKMLRQCAKNYNPMGYLTRGVVYRPGDDGRRGVRVAADGVPVMRASLISPLNAGGRVEEVVERISRAILLGLVVDGEQLPTEVEVAHQLRVSPMTLREALAVLRPRCSGAAPPPPRRGPWPTSGSPAPVPPRWGPRGGPPRRPSAACSTRPNSWRRPRAAATGCGRTAGSTWRSPWPRSRSACPGSR